MLGTSETAAVPRRTTWRCSTSTASSTSAADAVPGAPEALAAARSAGMHLAFVTNNAARTPDAVADAPAPTSASTPHDEDVVTSRPGRRPAAGRPARRRAPRSSLLGARRARGGAARARACEPVTRSTTTSAAVAQGYGPEVPWRGDHAGAVLVRDGLPWVASNTDLTIPTAVGIGARATAPWSSCSRGSPGVEPEVAGKPERPLFDETLRRVGGERPLVVGDRLDTDIEGAVAVGSDTLLVLTGVTGLARAGGGARPSSGRRTSRPTSAALAAAAAGARGRPTGRRARRLDARASTTAACGVEGEGSATDWWRVVAVAAWRHLDDDRAACRDRRRRPSAGVACAP